MANLEHLKQYLYVYFFILSLELSYSHSGRINTNNDDLSESLHAFSREIFQNIGSIEKTRNFVISPLSLFMALSLISIGAKGTTLLQIQHALRLPTDSVTSMTAVTKMANSILDQDNQDVVFNISNFMWVPRGLALKSQYARSVQDIFLTRVRDADFTRVEEVRELINKRIEKMTRGHIQELFPGGSITKQTKVLLANAIYFKGLWLHAFERTSTCEQPFTTTDKRSVVVSMMHRFGTFRAGVLHNVGAKAILLPYQGNRYGLLCVLPDYNTDLSEVENRLLSSGYTTTIMLRRMIQRDVNVTFPKFNIKFDSDMTPIFHKMGIHTLFTEEADLSGMSSSSRSALLKVSNTFHQSIIEVNEEGSEATVATGFEITPLMGGFGDNSGPMEFKADRPFLFFLIDRENDNMPYVMGRLSNPSHVEVQNTHKTKYLSYSERGETLDYLNYPINRVPKTGSKLLNDSNITIEAEFQLPSPIRSSMFFAEEDSLIYPQTHSYFKYYKSIQQTGDRYFSKTVSPFHKPIVFPSDNYDETPL